MPRFNDRKCETFSVPLDLLSWQLVEAFCLFVFVYFKGEMALGGSFLFAFIYFKGEMVLVEG